MAPKGGKKAPKGPKLTPEEKKALAKAMLEEKKRLLEEEQKKLQFDILDREVRYGNITVKRHEKEWKRLLLDIAIPEMRKDLEYAWHNFERIIDAKDFTISLLMDEVRDSEEQYMMNIRSHCDNVDKLVNIFRDQLQELKEDNQNTLQELKENMEREFGNIRMSHAEGEEFLSMMLYGLEMTLKDQEQYIRCEYCSRIEEEDGKNIEMLQKLKFTVNKEFTRLWNKTQDFLYDYYTRTDLRRKQYHYLNAQDEQLTGLLKSQLERLRQMNNKIKSLKQKNLDLQSNQGQKVNDRVLERKFFADSFLALKTQLEEEITTDNQNLTLLTVESNESVNHLQKIKKKGEQILKVAALCRKFETHYEKVLPFPLLAKSTANLPIDDIDFYNDIVDLKGFWKRVGQVDAIRYSMSEERDFLLQENDILRQKIHYYCECLDCPVYPPVKTRRVGNINQIDGNQEMKKYQKYI